MLFDREEMQVSYKGTITSTIQDTYEYNYTFGDAKQHAIITLEISPNERGMWQKKEKGGVAYANVNNIQVPEMFLKSQLKRICGPTQEYREMILREL